MWIVIWCVMSSGYATNPFAGLTGANEMMTRWVFLHARSVSDLLAALHHTGGAPLLKAVNWVSDPHRNGVWLSGLAQDVLPLSQMLHELDVPIPEIHIRARLVLMDDTSIKRLGGSFSTESATVQQASMGNGILTVPVLRWNNGSSLDITLKALESAGHAHIASAPELVVLNQTTAMIEAGEEVPYQEKTGEGNTSVTFKKAVLRLKVTPTLLGEQRILLKLGVNQDKPSSLLVNGVPAIETQQISTAVTMQAHETLALGGIYEDATEDQAEKTPGISHWPLIGALFRSHDVNRHHRQWVIFITPDIL
ncbi:MAG: hypothetical protein A3J38_10445 [Gammaproteobacteria bacterium RIFCSPHIGHO2_12_FULL_45_9]|nr:MAG: hypothetical protein A3J38_10445 [Gammaproteobacteria bacterium RIFCSPHIGHO2_12_FULL_45_9]